MKITIFLRIGIDIPLKQIRGIAIPRGIFYVFPKKNNNHPYYFYFLSNLKNKNKNHQQYLCSVFLFFKLKRKRNNVCFYK